MSPQQLAWVILTMIVLVCAVDFVLMVRRSRQWKDIARDQHAAQVRRERRGR